LELHYPYWAFNNKELLHLFETVREDTNETTIEIYYSSMQIWNDKRELLLTLGLDGDSIQLCLSYLWVSE
jgi:hypothetical protein